MFDLVALIEQIENRFLLLNKGHETEKKMQKSILF